MKAVIVTALLMVCTVMGAPTTDDLFSDFKATHARNYVSPGEERKRFEIFAANMKKAAELNRKNPMATFGPNEFADMSSEEFQTRHNAARHYAAAKARRAKHTKSFTKEEIKAADGQKIDWRLKGAVTSVKNQGSCGSCWSFSTTGNIEGQNAIATGNLVSLSEQELVSCDTTDNGCNGGLMDNAFGWLISTRGGQIATEASYPYVSGNGIVPACSYNLDNKPVGATISNFQDITGTEEDMAAFVFNYGPLSIGVDASTWQSYAGGIITYCPDVQIDHGVLIVGYDDTAPTPYWIIKNSWTANWGEDGYIRVAKGSNMCGLTSTPSSSVVGNGHRSIPALTIPESGYLIQMTCLDAKCSDGCSRMTLPLQMCLPLKEGGSVIAACYPSQVTLSMFQTTDCTGPLRTINMPQNQCLISYTGYFENICASYTNFALPKGLLLPRRF
uniref:Cathepsin L isotype 1 n=1 Tax=Trypanoplasma borreli TaxID=5710 RepID=A5HLX9_TRYBO|nr:cathepsin L isotype 1 [Trypanoplasma borreli]